MKWSWRAGSLFGIAVYIHWTFVILLGWIALGHVQSNGSLLQFVVGIVSISVLFGVVLLHELGHSLMARRYGIQTKDITLLPIGGVARLERMPDKPRQEFWVAIAGPAVNVALAVISGIILFIGYGHVPMLGGIGFETPPLEQFFFVNVYLVLFNMLPAFPMDGGRVLRAILASRLPYAQATRIAASVGQAMALLFVLAGFMTGNFMLFFIAMFVWLGAEGEASMAQVKSALGDATVRQAMITRFRSLSPHDPLSAAVDDIFSGFQQDFPVLDHVGRIVGILTYAGLIKALSDSGPRLPVANAMSNEIGMCSPTDRLEEVLPKLQASASSTFAVMDHGVLVGLLTLGNLSEFIMVRSAMQQGANQVNPL
ncbi:MAG: site-2 protease family protein [Candidatus Hydrogenedentes bacterium]|nr:site-2 protease family protein [Candidatus Hydrogenedentota bacterium]